MKFAALLASALAIGALSIANADARSIQIQKHEVLPRVQIDGQATPYIGILDIDFMRKTIQVQIVQDPCGSLTAKPGEIHCMAAVMLKETFRAKLNVAEVVGCGSSHYTGTSGVDTNGNLISIDVVDHSTRRCMDMRVDAMDVSISKMSTVNGPTVEYRLSR